MAETWGPPIIVVGGVGVFLPLGCATSYDGVEQTVCHSAVGIPIPEAIGTAAGLMLGVVLVGLVIVLYGRRPSAVMRRSGSGPIHPERR